MFFFVFFYFYFFLLFFFFFSSRRRHTRLVSDWSSDVCSSDLMAKMRRITRNRVLTDLIQTGLRTTRSERELFLTLASRFKESSEPAESARLREKLARLIFDE